LASPSVPLRTVLSLTGKFLRVSFPCSIMPMRATNCVVSPEKPSLFVSPVTFDSIKSDLVPLCIAKRLAAILS
jgi:hypothetical protein